MKFLRAKEIKVGMRTAKPIYNKEGVLLYGRNTIINESFINNVGNLDVVGIYILEPTEPLPPISEEEEEFEKFQTVTCYALRKQLDKAASGESFEIDKIVADIVGHYGGLNKKIHFMQIIRSNEDFPYKHALSVAIICALITNAMKLDVKEQNYIVSAALLHDLGKIIAPNEIINKVGKLTKEELKVVREAEEAGFEIIRNNYLLSAGIRRYITQLCNEHNKKYSKKNQVDQKLLLGTKIIQVADMFDILTAMRIYKEPMSEFSAIQFFQEREDEFDEKIVMALVASIEVLPVGACVELTNGEKGLVLAESEYFPLRPRILGFGNNTMYDLSQKKVYEQVKIKDIMKTMDNRFVMSDTKK